MPPEPEDGQLVKMEELLQEARAAIDHGDVATTRKLARKVLARLRPTPTSRRGRTAFVTAHLQLAWVHNAVGEFEEGLQHIAAARAVEPDELECDYLEGCLRLGLWELDHAEECFHAAVDLPEVASSAWYYLAILADLRDEIDRADELYATAHAKDPKRFRLPVRISDDEAEALLHDVVQALPAQLQKLLQDPLIELRAVPDPKVDDAHPETLGIYTGVTLAEQSSRFFPDTIRVFKRSIERVARDAEDLREQLRITLLHEIGHHFGYDEDELDGMGLG